MTAGRTAPVASMEDSRVQQKTRAYSYSVPHATRVVEAKCSEMGDEQATPRRRERRRWAQVSPIPASIDGE